jgi:hypothetical protein
MKHAARHRFVTLTLALGLLAGSASAFSFHAVKPSDTTPGIDPQFDHFHEIYYSVTAPKRNKLVVFLPGTGVAPNVYKLFPETAAENGFHVINLTYVNSFQFIGMAATNNCDACYVETRTEILTGQNLSQFEDIDRNNSIEHRLIKALEWMDTNYPTQNWAQFLDGTNILWEFIVIAGHSQGAGQAGFIAKQVEVDRAIMFDSGDWYEPETRPATWISTPGATPAIKFYGAAHTNDPLFPNPHQIPAWTAFGLTNFGPIIFAENTSDPQFLCSRMIRTAVEPRNNNGETAYHGAMVRDLHVPLDANNTPIFRSLWEYMLFGPLRCNATFDGDTRHDLGTFHPPTGTWELQQSVDGFDEISFGAAGMIPVEADYNGDGLLDLAVYEKATGTWHQDLSGQGYRNIQFGSSTMIPVPADYDGDGTDDPAVFDPASGTWYTLRSRDGFQTDQFGTSTMRPAPADFDGDGKTDLAVYDARNATWYLFQSRRGFTTFTLGPRNGLPVPGDYDGDGRADPGVFDPPTGNWHLKKSFEGDTVVQFGYQGTIPVNRDTDGDGRADLGVFDPRRATWFLFQSRDGFRQTQFGQRFAIPLGTPLRGDIPLPILRRY